MSNEKIDKAFGGKPGGESAEIDYKSEYEKLVKERELDSIEKGRLKKVNARVEELERENAQLRERKREEDLMGHLSQDERDSNPDLTLTAMAKVAGAAADGIRSEFEERMAKLEGDRRAESEAAMSRNRESLRENLMKYCPKFFTDIEDGGDKAAAWARYKRFNEASVVQAWNACDLDSIKWHIQQFYHSMLGVEVPSGSVSTAPDPSPAGGTQAPIGGGRIYTQDEFSKLFDLKETARDRGDWAEVRRISDEINRASAEGRVK